MSLRSLHTYSLIKALYDQGKDYIDSFWPFLLQVMPRDKRALDAAPLADEIRRRFGLSVPVHTVQTLAERAKRAHGYLQRESGRYSLTDRGVKYLESLETPRQVERRLNALVDHAAEDIGSLDERFRDRQFTQDAMTQVIDTNSRVFDFIVERNGAEPVAASRSVEQAVLAYFTRLEQRHPVHFEALRDLILGSTLSGLLKRDDITDATRHFSPTELFLDTNIVLSLLGLRFEMECRPAVELLALLNRSARFVLYVFDFTISELTNLLHNYGVGSQKYLPHVQVSALYSCLKYRGVTPSQITLLIADLPVRLRALGIGIIATGINLSEVPDGTQDAMSKLRTYKPEQDERAQRHDLAAIALVALGRGRDTPRKVEEARAFFLTEDYRLSNYAFIERGHRANHTVSEVMPDRLLTNLLWLKDPDAFEALPMSAVIAMHSRGLFIDRHVWERFHGELGRMTASGELAQEAASLLLYDNQVHKDLVGLGTASSLPDKEWLLGRLEDVRRRQEEAEEQHLAEQQRRLDEGHQAELIARKRDTDAVISAAEERLSTLEGQLSAERRAATLREQRLLAAEKGVAIRHAHWLTVLTKVFVAALIVAGLTILGRLVIRRWSSAEGPLTVGLLVGNAILTALGIRVDPGSAWQRLESVLADWLLAPRVQRVERALREGVSSPLET